MGPVVGGEYWSMVRIVNGEIVQDSAPTPVSDHVLMNAHRSLRAAHSLGIAIMFVALLFWLLGLFSIQFTALVGCLAVIIAWSAGQSLHAGLPHMLQEGSPPSEAHVQFARGCGMFRISAPL